MHTPVHVRYAARFHSDAIAKRDKERAKRRQKWPAGRRGQDPLQRIGVEPLDPAMEKAAVVRLADEECRQRDLLHQKLLQKYAPDARRVRLDEDGHVDQVTRLAVDVFEKRRNVLQKAFNKHSTRIGAFRHTTAAARERQRARRTGASVPKSEA
eukprot:gene2072-666_t